MVRGMGSSDAPQGSGVLRHAPRDQQWVPAAEPDPYAVEAIGQHVTHHFGPISYVWHELASDLVRIDIHVVTPTAERPFYTLVTDGMSDLAMSVPAEANDSPYAELMLCLPADWELSGDTFREDRNYWPIGLLKSIARLPHEYNTWIGLWHSVPNGDPPSPYLPGVPFAGALVAPMLRCDPSAHVIKTESGKDISLLALVPLHPAEVALKVRSGTDALLDALATVEISELFSPTRPSAV